MTIASRAALVLQQINAALALAEKANTGYVHREEEPFAVYMGNDLQQQWIQLHSVKPLDDGRFIAAARTLLPTSLRCLKTAIEGLLGLDTSARGWKDDNGCAGAALYHIRCALTTLCDQWEASRK